MAVKLLASLAGRALPPERSSGTHFSYRLSKLQGHSAAGNIGSLENCSGFTANRTRDLTTSSVVPRASTIPRNISKYNSLLFTSTYPKFAEVHLMFCHAISLLVMA
jgi:hypothetical protein